MATEWKESQNETPVEAIEAHHPHRPSSPDDDEPAGEVPPPVQETADDCTRRRWTESHFAVGLTKTTWADEEAGCLDLCNACWCSNSRYSYVLCSAALCCKAGRVGNMVVLAQRTETIQDSRGQHMQRPQILCVVGPYWMIPLCLTIPLFAALSTWTAFSRLPDQHIAVVITWALCQAGLFLSLANVAFRDPGILYRHHEPPSGEEDSWLWNDQALTYRPGHAKFDPECQVMINHYDHTCPWTGTAIGQNNMPWFRSFLVFVPCVLFYDVILLTFN